MEAIAHANVGELVEVTPEGAWIVRAARPASSPALLLPGAFNPAHDGHWALAEAAERWLGKPAAFELSRANVDKPELADSEVHRRAEQFRARAPLWITRAPTFVAKAELFPGTVFVAGADTAARIVAVRYYDGNAECMRHSLERLRLQGCRFLVGGRADAAGNFIRLGDVGIPAELRDLFVEIPPERFRHDISSTALRQLRSAR